MKTDLATIDRVVGERIDAMRKNPPVSQATADAARQPVEVAGFKVVDEAVVSTKLKAAQDRTIAALERYANDSAAITIGLKNVGVTPLAIVPRAAWHKICFDSGLIFIEQSQVLLNTWAIAQRLLEEVRVANRTPPVSTLQRLAGKQHEPVRRLTIEQAIDAYLAPMTPIQQLRSLTFGGSTFRPFTEMARQYGLPAELVLPDPPADVVDVLCRVKNLRPTTAAEPGAVSIRGMSIAQAIRQTCLAVEADAQSFSAAIGRVTGSPANDEEARALGYQDRADWVRRCPIVHIDAGTATAVVAQFGDFPIEKEVVERAIAGEIFEPLEERPTTGREVMARAAAFVIAGGQEPYDDAGGFGGRTASEIYREALAHVQRRDGPGREGQ